MNVFEKFVLLFTNDKLTEAALEDLINGGLNINTPSKLFPNGNNFATTALFSAVEFRRINMVELLLKFNADPNFNKSDNNIVETCLMGCNVSCTDDYYTCKKLKNIGES